MSDSEFNRYAAGEFISEYQRETGQLYTLKSVEQAFPDMILEAPDGRAVDVEFVSIVLAFVNREQRYFDRYRRSFLAAIQSESPRYGRVKITLQLHHSFVGKPRPMRLPDINGPEGRGLISDFKRLLSDRFEDVSKVDGGNDGHALLDQLRDTTDQLYYPVLARYFGAILFHHMSESEASANNVAAGDPLIAYPVVW